MHNDMDRNENPDKQSMSRRARLLRSLHDGEALVLPNAWDAASAALVTGAGARAIATSSGAVAWSLGYADGEQLTRHDMAEAVRRIVAVVDVPVTADMEGGYGPEPEDVEATVRATLEAGAVGLNLEDSNGPDGSLVDVAAQSRRIRAAREAAESYGVPEFVINARTDVYLNAAGVPGDRPDEVRTRARAYVEAGADCLFVPGLLDLVALEALAKDLPVPVNAMAVPGGPSITELTAAGVRRISVGTTLAQVAYGAVQHAAAEILASGTFHACAGALEFSDAQSLFARLDQPLPALRTTRGLVQD